MDHQLKPGLNYSLHKVINENDLANTTSVSNVAFASTPSLIILMEQTCHALIQEKVIGDLTSVNAEINIKHIKPLPVNQKVTCEVYLKFVDDKKLFFDFILTNEKNEVIAIGAHERIIVNTYTYNNSLS